jgi:hypothetical protein
LQPLGQHVSEVLHVAPPLQLHTATLPLLDALQTSPGRQKELPH